MVVNFKTRKINQNKHKLTQTLTLIIIKKKYKVALSPHLYVFHLYQNTY
jgi:hypothetical protein